MRRPAALLIAFEGESERGGREGEEPTCPCTKCTHMHVVFPSISLSYISVLLLKPLSIQKTPSLFTYSRNPMRSSQKKLRKKCLVAMSLKETIV